MDNRCPVAPVSSSIVLFGVRIQAPSGIVVHVMSLVAFDTGWLIKEIPGTGLHAQLSRAWRESFGIPCVAAFIMIIIF